MTYKIHSFPTFYRFSKRWYETIYLFANLKNISKFILRLDKLSHENKMKAKHDS